MFIITKFFLFMYSLNVVPLVSGLGLLLSHIGW